MTRRRRRGRWVAAAIVLLAAAGGIGAYLLTAGSSKAPAAQPLATATARRGTLTQTVDASFTLVRDPQVTLRSPAAGTVTSLALTQGKRLGALTPLLAVNGTTIYGIPSSTPLYRDLGDGDSGDDVKALQAALKAAGYDPGDIDGDFASATVSALEAWQDAKGLDATGKLSRSLFVTYPPRSSVLGVSVHVGDQVTGQTALASLDVPGGLLAQADVSQLDVGRLATGQQARLTFDALSSATGQATVISIPAQAESTTQSAGSSTVVQYAVTLRPARLPAGAREGMTGQATITVVSRRNVVIVPTSAIGGSGSNPAVQVLVGGQTVTRPVIVGLATAAGSEIVSGVQPGEQVVTGVSASSQTGATSTTQGGQQGPGGGGPPGPGGFGGVVQ